jgi:CheY-like chemotaxis protein
VDQALEQLKEFVGRQTRQVLLVMPDGQARKTVIEHLGAADIGMLVAWSRDEAYRILKSQPIDCLVVDESAHDLGPQDVLDAMESKAVMRMLPVVFFGARGEQMLARWKGAFALREARTTERLLDYIYFFVHRSTASMSENERKALEELHSSQRVLEKKRALLVDDDMRNLFALSKVLRGWGLQVDMAQDGYKALAALQTGERPDLILMDIMMPGMDGYTTIRNIRDMAGFTTLPIIAVTAKAMTGDREVCLQMGASDYLSKPIDIDKLAVMLRSWLTSEPS